MAYNDAWQVQRDVHAAVLAGRSAETLLLVEHEPVVTIGRRPGAAEHLVAAPRRLEQLGVKVCQTNRGGDITYHGPGQVVAYPIVNLQRRRLNLRRYVNMLEQAVIETVAEYAIAARRDPDAIGVWVDAPDEPAKIAAIGVRAERWVTMHGLALNIQPDLEHFKLIVPCGLAGRPVTSMRQLLGDACPPVERVRSVLAAKLMERLD